LQKLLNLNRSQTTCQWILSQRLLLTTLDILYQRLSCLGEEKID
jgi:hypothetical protein